VSEPHPGPSEQADTTDAPEPSGSERHGHGSEDEIDEASDESFPASDAPQWWSGPPDDRD
jgi:hypothetical protein